MGGYGSREGAEGIAELLSKAGELKRLKRTGWVKAGVDTPESVADHSFRTALMALLAAEAEGLDALKCAKMALLHDLAESVVGDITPDDPKYAGKDKAEAKAMREMLSDLEGGQSLLAHWNELRDGTSPEAMLVLDADKLEMWLQAAEYERLQGKDLTEFRLSAEAAVRSDAGRRLLKALQKEEGEG